MIDGDDPLSAEQVSALNRELTDRPTTPNCDGVSRLDVAVLGSHVTSGENVRKKKHLLVAQFIRNLYWSNIGKRHAYVLRLTSRVTAHHVRIAEKPRARESIQRLRGSGVRIAIVASGPEISFAEEANA